MKSKIILLILALCILGIFYWASIKGWNVSTLHNPEIIRQVNVNCPENEKDVHGNCPPKYTPSYTFYYPFIIGNTFRGSGRQNGVGSSRGGGK